MSLQLRAILLVLVLAWLPAACDKADSAVPTPADGERVTVARVLDGDTVDLADGRRVRYLGVNTPERGQPFYEEATDANRRFVEGREAWLAPDVQPTDQYGRTLAYLWVGGQFVNRELVLQGLATLYTEAPNVRYTEALVAAQQAAREAEVGLWAPAGLPIKIQKIYYDAPGSDPENPNGEWVEIVNDGSKAVDLTGFSLKDEANHIYTFPAATLAPGRLLKVYSGQGADSGGALYWGLVGDAVWNNDGDTAFLRDPQGRLVDIYEYGQP
jgi:micrococcal nuclease